MPSKKIDKANSPASNSESENPVENAHTESSEGTENKQQGIIARAFTRRTPTRKRDAAPSFFGVNYNELDKDLSPEHSKEWTDIYASHRSKTPLTGTVIGIEAHKLTVTDTVTKKREQKEILCIVIMNFRVKVIIPQTELWFDREEEVPDFVVKRLVGAKINYIITNVEREAECAIASRRMALRYERNRFFKDSRKNEPGAILDCNVLVVGPNRIIAECNGFDLQLWNRDLSYTAVADLRAEYRTGQEIKAKLLRADREAGVLEVSVKALNPNPFFGAEKRHPVGCTRQAVISGTYAGGIFCRMNDDTTCLCLYSPGYFNEEFSKGDTVLIGINEYDYAKKQIFGRILSRLN